MPAPTPAAITVSPKQTATALRTLIRARRPAFLWGQPGIGKSDIMRQVADELYAARYGYSVDANGRLHDPQGQYTNERPYHIDLRASLLDPVDLRGLPAVDTTRDLTRWIAPEFLPRDGEGVLFLDELNRAPMLVQNALLQLTLDRRLGEYTLPDGWTIVAAGNRESDGGGVQRMSSALSFRFVHLNVEPNVSDWCAWAAKSGIHPMVLAFQRFRQQNPDQGNVFCAFDPKAQASPNPRAWQFVSEIMHAQPDPDVELALVAGAVGHSAAVEFLGFARLFRELPSIDGILLNPDTAKVPDRVAALYAVSAALAARSTPTNFGRVLRYLGRLPAEYAVFAVKDATARDDSLCQTAEFTTWAIDHSDALN